MLTLQENKSVFILSVLIISTSILLISPEVWAKRAKQVQAKCQSEECQLSQSHFVLYSALKQAVESDFDLKGKELIPIIRAYETLDRRFSKQNQNLNGTKLVRELLSDERLSNAIKSFNSEDGRALIDLYRSSIDGKLQNLACSQRRLEDIERAARKLEANPQISKVLSKAHANFVQKSAKKCFKRSCNSVDGAMSRLDVVLGKASSLLNFRNSNSKLYAGEIQEDQNNFVGETNHLEPEMPHEQSLTSALFTRELESEELELCRFFKRSNETDCKISNDELSKVDFVKAKSSSNYISFRETLKSYYLNRFAPANQSFELVVEQRQLDEATRKIVSQCGSLRDLLDYNLVTLKYYLKQNLIDEKKLAYRSSWCPSLTYWLQIDRLCGQIESSPSNLLLEDSNKELSANETSIAY